MHELSLMCQVPSARHEQISQILTGLTAMQPARVIERHLIFKPRRVPGVKGGQVGGSQGIQNPQTQALQGQLQGELFYLQLVGEVKDNAFPSTNDAGVPPDHGADTTMEDVAATGAAAREKLNGLTPVSNGSSPSGLAKQSWSLRFNDLPEVPGKRPVTSRMISTVDIMEGDVMKFMDEFGYRFGSRDRGN